MSVRMNIIVGSLRSDFLSVSQRQFAREVVAQATARSLYLTIGTNKRLAQHHLAALRGKSLWSIYHTVRKYDKQEGIRPSGRRVTTPAPRPAPRPARRHESSFC